MRFRFTLIFGLLICFWSCSNEGSFINSGKWTFKKVGEQQWTQELPDEAGEYWLKTSVKINQPLKEHTAYGLFLNILASSEIYWDNTLIGRNGNVGRSMDEEIPGQIEKVFLVPEQYLNQGDHEILIHFSNFHTNGNIRFYIIGLSEYWLLARQSLIKTCFIHIYAGFFLIIGLYFAIRFLFNRLEITNFLFALISIAFFTKTIFEYLKFYYAYPYPWHFPRLRIILGLTLLISFLLPLLFSFQFKIPRKEVIFIVIFQLLLLPPLFYLWPYLGYDLVTQGVMLIGLVTSLYITFKSYLQKKKGSTLALIGVAPITLSSWFWIPYYDYIIFVGFGHLSLMTLITLAMRERDQQKKKQGL